MWKENKRQRGSTRESPSYNKIIATLWETNNMLLLSRTVSVTSWQVHLKLIMYLLLNFALLLGLDPANTSSRASCPGSQCSFFRGSEWVSTGSVAFPWTITATKRLLPRNWDFPATHAWQGGCWRCGTCLSPMPTKRNIWLLPTGKSCITPSTYIVQLPFFSSYSLFVAPWCWKAFAQTMYSPLYRDAGLTLHISTVAECPLLHLKSSTPYFCIYSNLLTHPTFIHVMECLGCLRVIFKCQ